MIIAAHHADHAMCKLGIAAYWFDIRLTVVESNDALDIDHSDRVAKRIQPRALIASSGCSTNLRCNGFPDHMGIAVLQRVLRPRPRGCDRRGAGVAARAAQGPVSAVALCACRDNTSRTRGVCVVSADAEPKLFRMNVYTAYTAAARRSSRFHESAGSAPTSSASNGCASPSGARSAKTLDLGSDDIDTLWSPPNDDRRSESGTSPTVRANPVSRLRVEPRDPEPVGSRVEVRHHRELPTAPTGGSRFRRF